MLNDYEWTTYKSLEPRVKEAIEEALLKAIIMRRFPSLSREEATAACFRLLQDEGTRGLFLSCWEGQSFESLRSHSRFFYMESLQMC
jgi:hypothetical protein